MLLTSPSHYQRKYQLIDSKTEVINFVSNFICLPIIQNWAINMNYFNRLVTIRMTFTPIAMVSSTNRRELIPSVGQNSLVKISRRATDLIHTDEPWGSVVHLNFPRKSFSYQHCLSPVRYIYIYRVSHLNNVYTLLTDVFLSKETLILILY